MVMGIELMFKTRQLFINQTNYLFSYQMRITDREKVGMILSKLFGSKTRTMKGALQTLFFYPPRETIKNIVHTSIKIYAIDSR